MLNINKDTIAMKTIYLIPEMSFVEMGSESIIASSRKGTTSDAFTKRNDANFDDYEEEEW